jgi:site-specific DNA recombinase
MAAARIGRHHFNTKHWKTRERKPEAEVVEMIVPPIIDVAEFEAVQTLLKAPRTDRAARRQRTDAPYWHLLLRRLRRGNDTENREERQIQVLHLLHQGPAGRDRLQGPHRSDGKARQRGGRAHRASPLTTQRLEEVLSAVLHRRKERAERRTEHIAELRKRAAEAEAKLKRLYDAIENGIVDVSDPLLKERVTELKTIRDQARADAERAEGALDRAGPSITPQALKTFASQARRRMRTETGGYPYLALLQSHGGSGQRLIHI